MGNTNACDSGCLGKDLLIAEAEVEKEAAKEKARGLQGSPTP